MQAHLHDGKSESFMDCIVATVKPFFRNTIPFFEAGLNKSGQKECGIRCHMMILKFQMLHACSREANPMNDGREDTENQLSQAD